MLVIKTKYLGPTDHKGSRIKATSDLGSITIPYRGDCEAREAHRRAVIALCTKVWGQLSSIKTLAGNWLGNDMYWLTAPVAPELCELEYKEGGE